MTISFVHLVTVFIAMMQGWFGVSVPAPHSAAPALALWATTTAQVVRVIDGDTIDVTVPAGQTVRVRYIGMNTPEIYPTVECGGKEAADQNRVLVAGKQVTLIPGPGLYDKYGRRLAYVYVGNLFVNETLVQEGWAALMMIPPNTAYRELFERLQTAARSKGVGIWSCPDLSGTP